MLFPVSSLDHFLFLLCDVVGGCSDGRGAEKDRLADRLEAGVRMGRPELESPIRTF